MDISRPGAPAPARGGEADPVARARALRPLLEAHGPGMDRAAELAPEVLAALREGDFLRLLLPRALGGAALPLPRFAEVTEALAQGDASTAWCVCQGAVSAMSAAHHLDPAVARDLFGARESALAWGARHGRARAEVVQGGYRVTGRWEFGSGSRHATVLGAHVPVVLPDGTPRLGPDGRPEDRTVLFPRSAARILGEWHALGLRGTGSDTYEVEGLFVPESHACARDRPETLRQAGPLTLFASNLCYATGFAGVALGVARALMEALLELARGKAPRAAAQLMRDNNAVQFQLGQLEARLRAARMYLLGTAREVWEEAEATGALTLDARMALRLATTHAIGEATEVSVACYRAAGTTAVLEGAPFERRFRDALCVSQHLQGGPWHVEMVGRHLLGVDQPLQFV
jgi:alkylation response protein AidB-like acyl-CoA dehydrogenase